MSKIELAEEPRRLKRVKSKRKAATPQVDLRSPLARARDEWFESEHGQRAADPGTLGSNPASYLRNRLESAFFAGAQAQQKIDGTKP